MRQTGESLPIGMALTDSVPYLRTVLRRCGSMPGLCERWDRRVPAACPYTYAEIVGYEGRWPDPVPDCWPPPPWRAG